MGQSLSRSSQDILDAAAHGEVAWLRQQMALEPKLVKSVTLLKRRGILHLAAKEGHSQVLNAVIEPLIAAVREEYLAQQAQVARAQVQTGAQQQQQAVNTADAEQPLHLSTDREARQQSAAHEPELQLASFSNLRQAVNARDLYHRTPLIVAAKQGHLESTQILVESASNMFAVDREGNTCLHYAALHGHVAVVQYLMQKARDRDLAQRFVNKRNLSGFTPLHYAVWSCKEQLVQCILEAGSDVTAVNDRVFDAWVTVPVGSTPLHLAAMRNHVPIALMLLQQYVVQLIAAAPEAPRLQDPRSMVNLYGMNPSQLAAHRSLRQISRILSPSLPLSRVLEAFQPSTRRLYGPLPLKSIAAGVLRIVLDQQLDRLQGELEADQAADAHEAAGQATVSEATGTSEAAPVLVCQSGCCAQLSAGVTGGTCCGADSACEVAALSTGCSMLCSVNVADSIRRADSDEIDSAGVPARNSARFVCPTPDLHILAQDDCSKLEHSCANSSAQCCEADCSRRGAAHISNSHQHCSIACEPDCTAVVAHSKAAASCDDEQCCVCWEDHLLVCINPCSHALCLGCARQLVANSAQAGAACPLCRGFIGTFKRLPGTA